MFISQCALGLTDQLDPNAGKVTIDILPDDVLVKIFHFYVNDNDGSNPWTNEWLRLVHVCRRWRYTVFALPRHLHLQLAYTGNIPFKIPDTLSVVPVVISESHLHLYIPPRLLPDQGHVWSNKVAALNSEHHTRICQIHLSNIPNSHVEAIKAAMQKPFPALTDLFLSVNGDRALCIPASFLGGSGPHLRTLTLKKCSYPAAQKLLLSANHLVTLSLKDIPDSGYISPDALVTAFSGMFRLETLQLEFRYPQSHIDPESLRPPPLTRTILPALTRFTFEGNHEYSEGLMAQIDAPLLYDLRIVFFMGRDFEVPQLYQFVSHREAFNTFHRAEMIIGDFQIFCRLSSAKPIDYHKQLWLEMRFGRVNRQLSSVAQDCVVSLPPLSNVKQLKIRPPLNWRDKLESESTPWLERLKPFTAVENLTVSYQFVRHVSHAMEMLDGEEVTEVLPALRNLFLRGCTWEPYRKAVKTFVAARQFSGYPLTVHYWDRNGGWENITDNLMFGG